MSRFTWFASLFACAITFEFAWGGPIVINEVAYDDSSTDDREFVELYNTDVVAVDISGWTLTGRDATTLNPTTTIPGAPNSGTTMLAPGGYYVIATSLSVLNANQMATASSFENDHDSMEIRDGSGVLQDAIIYESNKGMAGNLLGSGLPAEVGPGFFGNHATTDLAGTPLKGTLSIGRYVDGRDTNNNGRDFGVRPYTPGTSNNTGSISYYQVPDPTGQTIGDSVPGLTGSFVNARYIDPTVADSVNPNAITPAPTTGNRAIIAYDQTGGGNVVTSNQVFNTTQGGFSIYAYLETSDLPQQFSGSTTSPTNFLGSEITIYGIGGGDVYTNLTDLAGNVGVGSGALPAADNANGFTGIAWVYERTAVHGATAATQTLYLVDANDGGDSDLGGNTPLDWTILQTIDISGLSSDWFSLSLDVDALGNGAASFNGTSYNFTTSTDMHSGAFNVGYRENLSWAASGAADGTPEALMRPATFTIPEPSACLLSLLGVIGAWGSRRRS